MVAGGRSTGDEERFGLLVNIGNTTIHSVHRGHEEVVAPGGSMLASRADAGRLTVRGDRAAWIVIDMPRLSVTRPVPKAEDIVGKRLLGGEALRMVSGYAGLIFQREGFADPRSTRMSRRRSST